MQSLQAEAVRAQTQDLRSDGGHCCGKWKYRRYRDRARCCEHRGALGDCSIAIPVHVKKYSAHVTTDTVNAVVTGEKLSSSFLNRVLAEAAARGVQLEDGAKIKVHVTTRPDASVASRGGYRSPHGGCRSRRRLSSGQGKRQSGTGKSRTCTGGYFRTHVQQLAGENSEIPDSIHRSANCRQRIFPASLPPSECDGATGRIRSRSHEPQLIRGIHPDNRRCCKPDGRSGCCGIQGRAELPRGLPLWKWPYRGITCQIRGA